MIACELGEYAGTTWYDVGDGPKEVRYFRMMPVGEARPQNEVDEVRWIAVAEAGELLTHERDRLLLDQAL